MSTIPPTNPFHIARAYGVSPIAQVTPVAGASANARAVSQVAAPGPAAKLPSVAQRLVGATVPGRVDFSEALPKQVSGGVGGAATYSMYASAGAKNAAATAVTVGRSLDVRG